MSKQVPRIGFAQFRAVAVGCFGLPAGVTRCVLVALVGLADKDTGVVEGMSREAIAQAAGTSRAGVERALKELCKMGVIALERGATLQYRLLVEDWSEGLTLSPQRAHLEPSLQTQEGSPCYIEGLTLSPQRAHLEPSLPYTAFVSATEATDQDLDHDLLQKVVVSGATPEPASEPAPKPDPKPGPAQPSLPGLSEKKTTKAKPTITLSTIEQGVVDAIADDPSLDPLCPVASRAGLARDLCRLARVGVDVAYEVAAAGAWCRAKPSQAPRKRGGAFLLNWIRNAFAHPAAREAGDDARLDDDPEFMAALRAQTEKCRPAAEARQRELEERLAKTTLSSAAQALLDRHNSGSPVRGVEIVRAVFAAKAARGGL